jgi:Membrane-associated phospholipid phosphatase
MKKKILNALNEKFAGIRYYQAGILLLVGLIFIIVGSVKDLAISQAIVKQNNIFGTLGAIIGPYPAYLLFGGTGVLFFINWQGEGQKDSKILAFICALIFPVLAGALYGYECLNDFITSSKYLAAFVGILAVGAGDVGLYFLCRHADKDKAYQAGVTFLFASATVLVLMYLLKKAGLRPRYYWMLTQTDPASYFRNWWDFDASVKEGFASNVAYQDTYFESWPSAHAALAGLTVLSVLLCNLNPKLEKKENFFVYGSLIWTIIVSAARVSDGHHFVSDVAFGAFFGTLFSLLVAYLVYLPAPQEEESEGTPVSGHRSKKSLSLAGQAFVAQKPHRRSTSHKPCKKVI